MALATVCATLCKYKVITFINSKSENTVSYENMFEGVSLKATAQQSGVQTVEQIKNRRIT